MDEADLRARNHVYRRFVELGRAPRLAEIAADLELPLEEAEAVLRRLHDAHALGLERAAAEIRMAKPLLGRPDELSRRGGRSELARELCLELDSK